jgi:hypothetical protein
MTHELKTSVGVETTRESIPISHFVTDEDRSLKVKRTEEFTDSKAELDFVRGVTAARA